MSKIAVATVFAASAMAQYGEPVVDTTAAAVDATPPEYYYADYDNLVVAAKDTLYYQSALTPEAIAREQSSASAADWSQPKEVAVKDVYNLKGATFCGQQDAKEAAWGGKYKQLFVAEAGDAENAGAVYGWDVAEVEGSPDKIALSGKWTVYQQEYSSVTDVECGPNNGLFIADHSNVDVAPEEVKEAAVAQQGVYWVTGKGLAEKKENPDYATVVPAGCAAVDDVRSLSWNADTGKLVWSNGVSEDAAMIDNAGVFSYGAPAGESPAAVKCECDAWAADCAAKIKKVDDAAAGEQVWAAAQGWQKVQVSKGDAGLYNTANKVDTKVADVPQVATYAEAPADEHRDVVFVADEKEGAVYSVAKNGKVAKVGEAPAAYGVAYNNGYGWTPTDSASSVTMAVGALLAAVAMLL